MSLGTLTARVALDTSPLSAGVKAAAMGFGLVAAGAAAAIYKVGSSYEQSLNTFQAVSSASAAQMAQVGAEAKKLGADMALPATSAADAAKAMTELAKSGLSVDEALHAAKGTLQLAAAAQVDEAKAAEITANALNAFGLKGSEAGRVADILAASANASSAEITDMADALQMSGAVAAAAHIPLEDLAAALGELANKGIKGSDAGTSVKQMLLSLEGPSKKAAGVMKQYGIDIYDATGKMKPFRDIIGNVSGALGGLADEQRDAALATIFGSDAVRAANIVLLGRVDAFDKMKVAVTKNGAAADVAAAKTKGLKGAFEGLKSQLEGVAISIYEKVAPGIERFVRSVAEGMPRVITQLGLGARAFQAAFSGEGITSDGFVGVMERLGVAARGLVADFKQAWPQIKAVVLDVTDRLVTAFENVVGWAREHWPEIKTIVGETMTTIRDVIAGGVDVVQTIWRNFGDQIKAVAGAAWEFVRGTIEGTLHTIQGIVQVITGIIHGDWGQAWDGIKQIVVGAWEVIEARVRLALTALKEVVSVGMEVVGAVFSAAWDGIKTGVREAMAYVVDKFLAMAEWIVRAAATAFGWVPGIGPKLREAAQEVEAFRNHVNETLRGITKDPIVVNVDTSLARASISQLRGELASLNADLAGSGSEDRARTRGLADATQGEIERREAAPSGATEQATGGIVGRAAGGLVAAASGMRRGFRTSGPRTLVGEGNPAWPEYVIATDPLYRLRNLGLLGQAAQAMGAGSAPASAPMDYNALAAALAPVLAAAVAADPIRSYVVASDVAKGLHGMRPR